MEVADCYWTAFQNSMKNSNELSPDSHILAMVKFSIPVQNFLICRFTFEMIVHFEKWISRYMQ